MFLIYSLGLILSIILALIYLFKFSFKNCKRIEGSFPVTLDNITYIPSKFKKKVLDNVSISLNPSEIVAIIGPNAAGKSSILKAISGELDSGSLSGEIKIGSTIIDRPVNRLLDGVGVVHQFDDRDIIEDLSILQNIAIRQILASSHKPKLFATPNSWQRELNTIIARLAIPLNRTDEIIKNLSGGDKQMLNVAIAIHLEHIKNPCGLLLLDEHTSRLSPSNAKKVMEFTMKEVKQNGITTIMVTHKYEDALKYADRILIVKNAKITNDIPKDSTDWNEVSLLTLVEA